MGSPPGPCPQRGPRTRGCTVSRRLGAPRQDAACSLCGCAPRPTGPRGGRCRRGENGGRSCGPSGGRPVAPHRLCKHVWCPHWGQLTGKNYTDSPKVKGSWLQVHREKACVDLKPTKKQACGASSGRGGPAGSPRWASGPRDVIVRQGDAQPGSEEFNGFLCIRADLVGGKQN